MNIVVVISAIQFPQCFQWLQGVSCVIDGSPSARPFEVVQNFLSELPNDDVKWRFDDFLALDAFLACHKALGLPDTHAR